MPKVNLTETRVKALRPRKSPYDVRDGRLKGFGVRVLPSGAKRYFIHCQHEGQRFWKIVGSAGDAGLADARQSARTMLSAIRRDGNVPASRDETPFEIFAAQVFREYARIWKAGTLTVNRHYLRNQILPHFSGRRIADIDRQDVHRWFASLHSTPAAADRSVPVLSVIMREAEQRGLRPEDSNPCRGIRRYRRMGRERALSDAEIRRLAIALEDLEPNGTAGGSCPFALADGLSQIGASDAPLVRLSGRAAVPAR